MIFILILTNLLILSLPKFKSYFSNIFLYRINSICLLFSILLVANVINTTSIGSGLSIFNGFVQISLSNQYIELFIFLISTLILISLSSNILEFISPRQIFYNNNPLLLKNNNWISFYPLIILFNLLGASCLISSFDLLFLYISIELQSFSLYILSSINKTSVQSTGAGLKYFLVGGFASCLILLGIALIYSATGVTNFESLSILISNNNNIDLLGINIWIQSGFIFLITGFLIKLGAAPFHQWAPDVYDKVSTKVTTWLVLIPKLSIFILLFEIINNFSFRLSLTDAATATAATAATAEQAADNTIVNFLSETENYNLTQVLFQGGQELAFQLRDTSFMIEGYNLLKVFLVLSSLISLIIGSLLGLSQVRIKRLLAFSAISHIGFLLLSLSINTEIAIESFFFYLIQYTLTNLNIFIILLVLGDILNPSFVNVDINLPNTTIANTKQQLLSKVTERKNNPNLDINYISELKGIFEKNPILSLSLTVCLFSMAGVPPLIGFFGKQQILYSAISSDYVLLAFIAIITSVISAYYYLNVVKITNFTSFGIEKNISEYPSIYNAYKAYINLYVNSNKNLITYSRLDNPVIISNITSYLISVLTLILILFIVKPNLLLNSTHILALGIFYH